MDSNKIDHPQSAALSRYMTDNRIDKIIMKHVAGLEHEVLAD
jgi:hypothetical protein